MLPEDRSAAGESATWAPERPAPAGIGRLRGIEPLELNPRAFRTLISSPFIDEILGDPDRLPLILVSGPAPSLVDPGSLPIVVCYVGEHLGAPGPHRADLVVGPDDVGDLIEKIAAAPLASTALAVHMRSVPLNSVEHGLAAESAVYSALQAGPEFAAWRSRTMPSAATDSGPDGSGSGEDEAPTVRSSRDGARLEICLCRPHRHNAINTRLRDALHHELSVALSDATIRSITLTGEGPSFCSGGDLGEFGHRSDPATAHFLRTLRSPARRIHQLRDRVEARVHGATIGGGIEMASFAGRVVAHPDTRIALPETGLGLIPGAGGTVGIARRVGRQRTAALGLTGRSIDAPTALAWGLVDEVAGN